MASASIGVFDSGFGGLSVLRALRQALPSHDFVYLGDSGRAPYGGRDVHTLLDFSEQAVEFLFAQGCPLVVVACHTVSCVALRHLQQRYCQPGSGRHVLGVTIPAAEYAVQQGVNKIGVIATARTVASGTYLVEIGKLSSAEVVQRAAPLLAPLVEEGWEDTEIARAACARYLADLDGAEAVLLGCTHYPFLMPAMRAALGPDVRLLDPAPYVAQRMVDWLARHPGVVSPGTGGLRVVCTGDPQSFAWHGARFLGEPLDEVETLGESSGRLIFQDPGLVLTGQVVR